jgi:hypothetical protein
MSNRSERILDLEFLALKIERNRVEMEQLMAKAKKLRSNIESDIETRKKAASVSKPTSA